MLSGIGTLPAFSRRTRTAYNFFSRIFNALGLIVLMTSFGIGASADPQTTIVALGDSLTAGYGLPEQDAFPMQLERTLNQRGSNVRVVNAGVSGDTSAGGLERLDWAVADNPDLVIVELGANDGLRGLDPDTTRANIDAILTSLKERNIPILLSGMYAPPNLGREYGERFNAIYPELAQKHQVAFDPFFLEGVATDPKLNQADGIHPNAAGVTVIVERLAPQIENMLR